MVSVLVGNPAADIDADVEIAQLVSREPHTRSAANPEPGGPLANVPPGQISIGAAVHPEGFQEQAAFGANGQLPQPQAQAELTSGPHLRASVMLVALVLLVVTHLKAPQASIIPFMLLATTSTEALWCMPGELIVSLGPVPTCFLRRRIPYSDIASITEVRGRLRSTGLLLRRMLRFWRPLGFAYGLTLGKELVDIDLVPEAKKTAGYFMQQPILISVDQAEDIIAHVLYRQKYGPDAPLPASMLARSDNGPLAANKVKWVVLDCLDVVLSMHRRNATACDLFGFILAPIAAFVESQRTGTSEGDRDHSL